MNQKKKIFAISDIHGHFSELKEALANAGFDKKNEDHLLVCCGDYFDRGHENDRVLSFLEGIHNKVLIRGNHEDMLLKLLYSGKILDHHYLNGTMATLENFFGKYAIDPLTDRIDFEGKTRTVDTICEFIEDTVDYFETENFVFVHGWFPEDAITFESRGSSSKEAWEKARWEGWNLRYKGQRPLPDKTLVCGHVPTLFAANREMNRAPADSSIYEKEGLIVLDAGTFESGRINVLVVEDALL